MKKLRICSCNFCKKTSDDSPCRCFGHFTSSEDESWVCSFKTWEHFLAMRSSFSRNFALKPSHNCFHCSCKFSSSAKQISVSCEASCNDWMKKDGNDAVLLYFRNACRSSENSRQFFAFRTRSISARGNVIQCCLITDQLLLILRGKTDFPVQVRRRNERKGVRGRACLETMLIS